jgi:hypothetical protein
MPDTSDQPAPAPASDARAETIAALIRNGLSNSPVSQSDAAWRCLETRLPDIVAAIIKEA